MNNIKIDDLLFALFSGYAMTKATSDFIFKEPNKPKRRKQVKRTIKAQATKQQQTQSNKNYFFTVADDETQKYNIIVSNLEQRERKSGQIGKYNIIVE